MTDPSAITIRPAVLADLPTLLAMRRAMFRDMRFADESRIDDSARQFGVWVEPRLASGEFRAWLAQDGPDAVAGAAAWSYPWFPGVHDPTERIGYLLNVYTAPSHRRRGLARRLVLTCIEHLKAQGIRRIALHYSDEGKALYEGLGFVATKEMRLTFAEGLQ